MTTVQEHDRLKEAEALLRKVVELDHHQPDCAVREFRRRNKYLPPLHPGWKYAPACNCPLRDIVNFLNK